MCENGMPGLTPVHWYRLLCAVKVGGGWWLVLGTAGMHLTPSREGGNPSGSSGACRGVRCGAVPCIDLSAP